MAACKICKKSETSMLCICEGCLEELQRKVKDKGIQEFVTREKYLEKQKEIENLKHALEHITTTRDVLADKNERLLELNRELTEILESLVLQHKQLEEFVELQFFTPTPGDQICKNFNVDLVVVEKGWFERVEKLLAKCKEVE